MYYVIEITDTGWRQNKSEIKEVFKDKELAEQYTAILHKNHSDKRYLIAFVISDTDLFAK